MFRIFLEFALRRFSTNKPVGGGSDPREKKTRAGGGATVIIVGIIIK